MIRDLSYLPKTLFSRKSDPIMRQSPFFLNVIIVSHMFTFVIFVFNTISLIIDLMSFRYFMAVVAPHLSVYAMSLPDPKGKATKTIFPISTNGYST